MKLVQFLFAANQFADSRLLACAHLDGDRFGDGKRLFAALDRQRRQIVERDARPDFIAHRRRGQDLPGAGGRHQPRCDIRFVADGAVFMAYFAAHRARIQQATAHSDALHGKLIRSAAHVAQGNRRADGAFRIVAVADRRAEHAE